MIHIQSLSKSYHGVPALQNVDLHIKKGEVFGLLGPNGAGKSTLINCLSGLLQPDTGKVFIDGKELHKEPDSIKALLGVVPQEIALYDHLTATENLNFWGSLYDIPQKELKNRILHLLELVGLSDRKGEPVKQYSGGMKRRINIAVALLHQPEILLMDEPTVGVDPQSRNRIFEIIENLKNQGLSLIYTTHYMEEVERLCNRIAILDEGQLMAVGDLKSLKKTAGVQDEIQIELREYSEDVRRNLRQSLTDIQLIAPNVLMIKSPNIGKDIYPIIEQIQKAGGELKNIQTKEADLESVFLALTGKALRK